MARSKTSKAWMQRHVNDPHVRRAVAEGYRSRAAYKLQEIAKRDRLLRPGAIVVDLGAAPGGWSQVAVKAVQPGGRVIALDLLELQPVHGVEFVQGDFSEPAGLAAVENLLGGGAVDLVLSDMAPNMSGIATVDQARMAALAELALDFALAHLKPEGGLLVKVFHGVGFDDLVKRLRACFSEVQTRKPEASRSSSSEVYLLARRPRRQP